MPKLSKKRVRRKTIRKKKRVYRKTMMGGFLWSKKKIKNYRIKIPMGENNSLIDKPDCLPDSADYNSDDCGGCCTKYYTTNEPNGNGIMHTYYEERVNRLVIIEDEYNKLTDDQKPLILEETYQVKNNKKERLSTKEKQISKFHEGKLEIYPRVRPTHIDLEKHVFDIQPQKEDPYRRDHYEIIKKNMKVR